MRLPVVCLCSLALSSCANVAAREVADPDAITLRTAVYDVADTMHGLVQRTKERKKVGMFLDEATVVFNISSKSGGTDSLKLAAAGLPVAPATIGANAETSVTSEGLRGNQITLKFKNVASLGQDPGADKKTSNSQASSGHSGGNNGPVVVFGGALEKPIKLQDLIDAVKSK